MILGSGPNRIGQGIEFDYCCVHASFALRDAGFDTVMVNCNPETVSTDYDTSDRLFFEPLTFEDVMNVLEVESDRSSGRRLVGVIVALGGQTPLKLAGRIPEHLVLGTRPAAIDEAEDRERWSSLCARLEIPQPAGRHRGRRRPGPGHRRPHRLPGPGAAVVRPRRAGHGDRLRRRRPAPGHGRAGRLRHRSGREGGLSAERPVLVDRFLEDAIEVDVDAIRDHTGEVLIGGVMEHVEEAGVHSGDSACVIPPPTLSRRRRSRSSRATPGPSPRPSTCGARSTCSTR